MSKTKRQIALVCSMVLLGSVAAQAASVSPMTQQEQLEQARLADEARSERLQRPGRVEIEGIPALETAMPPAPGGPSFYIRQIRLEGMEPEFLFLYEKVADYEHREMNLATINEVARSLNQMLLDRGYATSRVIIPEQKLEHGMLSLVVQPGRIHKFIYSKDSYDITWRTAFPCREGDILNVRQLEQGIEQMQGVSSQTVSMRLLPAAKAGMSDIELTVTRTKPFHGLLSVDDSGLSSTGRLQLNANIAIDSPFYANDLLQVGFNGDGAMDGYERGTRSQSIYYRIPYGRESFSISYYRYKYHQTVHSIPYDFISGGETDVTTLTWEHLMSRDQRSKASFDVSLRKRNSHNFINDVEIPIQTLHTTALEVGISKVLYRQNYTVYGRVGHRMGLGWFGAMPENDYADGPKTRYHMWLFDFDYQRPFTMGHRPAIYTASFHGQWTMAGDKLYGVDMISMGNRYTVRGFDGEYTLMSESGWYLRNELASSVPKLHSDIYIGIDVGKVYGPSTEDLVGKNIAGAVLGMRGSFSSGLSYDVFAGLPIYKPDGYHTEHVTSGFTFSWRF